MPYSRTQSLGQEELLPDDGHLTWSGPSQSTPQRVRQGQGTLVMQSLGKCEAESARCRSKHATRRAGGTGSSRPVCLSGTALAAVASRCQQQRNRLRHSRGAQTRCISTAVCRSPSPLRGWPLGAAGVTERGREPVHLISKLVTHYSKRNGFYGKMSF